MANEELGLHRASVEALMKLSKKDPRRREIERLAQAAINGANTVEAAKPKDLVAATFELLERVGEPTLEEQEALTRKGFIFLPVAAKSLSQVYDDNQEYFGFVNSSQSLKSYAPPQTFEIALKPNALRIPKSNNCSQEKQLQMIGEYSQREIEQEIPNAKAIMLPATGYAQADIEFQKRNNGQKLFADYWVRALDTTIDPYVADVGRDLP